MTEEQLINAIASETQSLVRGEMRLRDLAGKFQAQTIACQGCRTRLAVLESALRKTQKTTQVQFLEKCMDK